MNVPESEESADVSLGEWPVPPRVPLPSPTLTGCGPLSECPVLSPSTWPSPRREYVNVSQELPPVARTEPGVCWDGGWQELGVT